MSTHDQRRDFIKKVGGLAAASLTTATGKRGHCADPESEETDVDARPEQPVVVGIMGLSRGRALARWFDAQPNVEVRYLCDADTARIDATIKAFGEQPATQKLAKSVRGEQDFRRMLDDDDLDVLVCAAPNHWHAPATILACQAGKDVYVEKPCSHNPWEGEAMVEVARKHGRVVQMGTQRRSSPGTQLAMNRLHAGAIGRTYMARAWYQSARGSIGHGKPTEVPPTLDYDLWQGPAPHRPYLDNVVHYNWHWRWHWGNGELGNNGVHSLDLCRWGLQVDYANHVSSSGGRYAFEDDQETPDTHTVGFTFADDKAVTWHGLSCNRHRNPFVVFYGTDGTLELDVNGNFRIFDRSDQIQEDHTGSHSGESLHIANFLEAVRRNEPELLNAPILEGHRSTLLCHVGNIAHRVGRSIRCDGVSGQIIDDAEAAQLWKREYDPKWQPTT